jgi:hypothetical protein
MNGLDLNNLETLPSGFILIIVTMIIITAAIFYLFSKKKWIVIGGKKVLPKSEFQERSSLASTKKAT